MKFNDTSTLQGLIQECEFNTGLGDTGISGDATMLAHFVRLINGRYHQVITMILDSQDDWDFDDNTITSTYPIATRPLVAGQRDYTFPQASSSWQLIGREGGAAASSAAINPLKIKRIDITYDGTNYYRAEAFDAQASGLGLGNDTITDQRFDKTAPKVDVRDNAAWIYPLANASDVSAGAKIRVEFQREPTEFTAASTTAEPGIDEAWHRMIAIGASWDFARAKGLAAEKSLAAQYLEYEQRLRRYYGTKNENSPRILTPRYEDYH